MRLTKQDSINLDRFGCAFREGVFFVNWRGKSPSQAPSSDIYACLGRFDTKSGPIVFLAFEIAAIRPLPSYYYFPFDLKNQIHTKYLSKLTTEGELRLRFIADRVICTRSHRMAPHLRLRAAEILTETMQQWKGMQEGKYDFDVALKLVERHGRIPALLNRLLLEDTVDELSQRIAEAIKTVPSENRELATVAVNKVAEAFTEYYRNNRNSVLEFFRDAPTAFTYIRDLYRIFADNPRGLTEFFRDALAASLSQKELEKINELVAFVLDILSLFRKPESPPTAASITSVPELAPGLSDLVRSMNISGISKGAASRFFQLIGLEVGGKPGRPPKDYSREYALKKAGRSWRAVAEDTLENDAETREEFGGLKYQALRFEQREALKHRVREGVRSFAKRAGKPFPPSKETKSLPPPGDVGQENFR